LGHLGLAAKGEKMEKENRKRSILKNIIIKDFLCLLNFELEFKKISSELCKVLNWYYPNPYNNENTSHEYWSISALKKYYKSSESKPSGLRKEHIVPIRVISEYIKESVTRRKLNYKSFKTFCEKYIKVAVITKKENSLLDKLFKDKMQKYFSNPILKKRQFNPWGRYIEFNRLHPNKKITIVHFKGIKEKIINLSYSSFMKLYKSTLNVGKTYTDKESSIKISIIKF
jgi:hypothetical protein